MDEFGRDVEDEDADAVAVPVKRLREADSHALVAHAGGQSSTALTNPADIFRSAATHAGGRTSSLLAPIMVLSGHASSATSVAFSPDGAAIASSSTDRSLFLWRTAGECENYGALRGHKSAVLQVGWTADGAKLVSASADKTVGIWDAESGAQVRTLKGHTRIVNAVCAAPAASRLRGTDTSGGRGDLLASVSDDGCARMWDTRSRAASATLTDKHPLLGVALSADGATVYTAGTDAVVRCWDVRTGGVFLELEGHTDTVTGLSLSHDGTKLLSASMDASLIAWDVRPFSGGGGGASEGGGRALRVFPGAANNFEQHVLRPAWAADDECVAVGSAVSLVLFFHVVGMEEGIGRRVRC